MEMGLRPDSVSGCQKTGTVRPDSNSQQGSLRSDKGFDARLASIWLAPPGLLDFYLDVHRTKPAKDGNCGSCGP